MGVVGASKSGSLSQIDKASGCLDIHVIDCSDAICIFACASIALGLIGRVLILHNLRTQCALSQLDAHRIVQQHPTLTGAGVTIRCQAHYNQAHQMMMEFQTRSMLKNLSAQFQYYVAAIAN